MKLSLLPKLVEKTSLGPSYFTLVKIFIHSQLRFWCPIMPKLAILAPLMPCPDFTDNSIIIIIIIIIIVF
jgi:hypothetical protein